MPRQERIKTRYPGVYYVEGTGADGKPEKIYYIFYRKNGKQVEEKAGRQFRDDMTAAKASHIRTQRLHGKAPTNQERREAQNISQDAWTIDRLWQEYSAQKLDSKGYRVDQGRYNKYLQANLGQREPQHIAQLDIDSLRISLTKTLKPQTVKHILALLNRIINFGTNKGLCPGLRFKIALPKVNNKKTEDLNNDQLIALLKAIEEDSNIQAANFMKIALVTGMRRGELFKLQWQDIDFERGFLHIRDPKGGQDQKIPLNAAAGQVLLKHPRTDSPFVFPGRDGGQRVDINKQVNRIKQRAGLPKNFRALHGLRHVYASTLASTGEVDLYTLQTLLTHKNPTMTQRYAHLRDEVLRRASDLAGDIFAGIADGTACREEQEQD